MDGVKLYNGVNMPCLGFGVFRLTEAGQCERAVSEALKAGYRMIDTAAFYGNEEAVAGLSERAAFPEKSCLLLPSCGS